MRILQLCPLWFPVTRDAHGGIETFLTHLISALEKLDCEIAILASGDSQTRAQLFPVLPLNIEGQMKEGIAEEYAYYEQHQLQLALQYSSRFDLLHSHIGCGAYLLSSISGLRDRVLHTLHTPVYKDMEWFVGQHPSIWFSTVSEYQARKLWQQGSNHCHVIHNGIDVREFNFHPKGGGGLLFIGRMEWVKGPDLAVQVARTLGCSLLLAGPIVEQKFFDQSIKPFLSDQIQYLGIVDHREKNELFAQADCVILPFRREEPFGLVAIEAMACGVPVVSLARGALTEIVEPGLNGYLASEEDELADLVKRAIKIDRSTIRSRIEARFDISVVAKQYYRLYQQMLDAVE
jgi:glycosyltransferase involved in cell wall biosynthesis